MDHVLLEEARPPPAEDKYTHRPLVDFPPSGWGDFFLSYPPATVEEGCKERMEELKDEVQEMFRNFNRTQHRAKTLRLIDDLQRLGIAYHFEEEINESLRVLAVQEDDDKESDDIQIVALRFSLLRQHGYNISSDVFQKFKDKGGKFKVELSLDMKGLLNLHEASSLGMREEAILDEAFKFCEGQMERYAAEHEADDDNLLATKIKHALETPSFRRFRRLEARNSIESYRKDGASNPVLLELASLDFNRVQSLHQTEIKALSIWWRELGVSEKLSFARQRVVETYFWSLGVHWEPRYSKGRVLLAKLIFLTTVMDDFFDAYGTFEELKLFNDMVQRWDFEPGDQLSGSARVFARFFKTVNDEIKDEVTSNGMLRHYHYVKECYKEYVQGYLVEATWARQGYTPTLKEYLRINSGYPLLICIAPLINGKEISIEALDWVLKRSPVVEASSIIGRVMDDIVTTQFEQQRMHVASCVQCYTKEYGVAEQEARIELNKMVENAWKDMNKGLIDPCPFKKYLNTLALDYSRVMEILYKKEDMFTNSSGETSKNIAAVLVHPIQG